MSTILNIDGKKLIFIHIPRTAGMSLEHLFDCDRGHIPIKYFKEKYFSFAFVRNPWDRLVSTFFYLNKGGTNQLDEWDRKIYLSKYGVDFVFFVKDAFKNPKIFNQQHLTPQFYWVSDEKGNLAVDFTGRFEHLQEDFDKLCRITGLGKVKLPHLNSSKHKYYKKYYDEESREIVAEAYKKDIEMFNYEF